MNEEDFKRCSKYNNQKLVINFHRNKKQKMVSITNANLVDSNIK